MTKTFLGLTVSCARCHDHKFDAISQKDYYALFGILSNGRPAQRVIESPSRLSKNETQLRELKKSIRRELALAWKKTGTDLAELLQKPPSEKWQEAIGEVSNHNPLRVWAKLRNAKKENFAREWEAQRKAFQASQDILDKRHEGAYRGTWKLSDEKQYASWSRSGQGLKGKPAPSGEFHVLGSGERIIDRILPSGAYTHLLSNKQNGTLSSPRFQFDEGTFGSGRSETREQPCDTLFGTTPGEERFTRKDLPTRVRKNGLVGIPNIGRGTKVTSRQLPIGITRWKQAEARNLGSA